MPKIIKMKSRYHVSDNGPASDCWRIVNSLIPVGSFSLRPDRAILVQDIAKRFVDDGPVQCVAVLQ